MLSKRDMSWCNVMTYRRTTLLIGFVLLCVVLHAVYHIDTHFFRRIPCETYVMLRGSDAIRAVEYQHTLPTTNITIQQYIADDVTLQKPSTWTTHPDLPRALTCEQTVRYMDLMKVLMFVFEKNNITYSMSHGTMLGSFFFHDFIPWDDDLDLMISLHDYPKVKQLYASGAFGELIEVRGRFDPVDEYTGSLLNKTVSEKYLYGRNYHKHKIFFKDDPDIPCYPWKWPFIDLTFFAHNETDVWKYDSTWVGPVWHLKYDDFFPMHKRPFGKIWVPAPRNPRKYLKANFKEFRCSVTHCHFEIQPNCIQTKGTIPCESLTLSYPHVVRSEGPHPGTTTETLRLGTKEIYSVIIPEVYQNISAPMVL